MKRFLLIGVAILLLAAAAWAIAPGYFSKDQLSKAEIAIDNGMWEYAREKLDQYLSTHPTDAQAHMLMAEALVRDNTLPSVEAAEQALEHLEAVPEGTKEYIDAQLKAARIRLFTLRMPGRAEIALKRVLDADPDSMDGNYLMWKLLDLTGRSYAAGENFWKVYDQTPVELRGPRLRQWYMSQFFPVAANPSLVDNMAFEPLPDIEAPDLQRLLHFYLAERDSPLNHAALAKWYLEDMNPDGALEMMVRSAKELDNEAAEPLFLMVLAHCHFKAGQTELAEKMYEQWPDSARKGYDYLVIKGMVHERCRAQFDIAAEAYAEALKSDWPGPVDWQLRNRYANCLARIDRNEEAVKQRELATRIADMMIPETHVANRDSLKDIEDAEALKKLLAFYEKLGCERETAAWSEWIERLEKREANQVSPLETAP